MKWEFSSYFFPHIDLRIVSVMCFCLFYDIHFVKVELIAEISQKLILYFNIKMHKNSDIIAMPCIYSRNIKGT